MVLFPPHRDLAFVVDAALAGYNGAVLAYGQVCQQSASMIHRNKPYADLLRQHGQQLKHDTMSLHTASANAIKISQSS